MSHSVIPTVNVYITSGNKVLLGRRANTGWMDGKLWPAGGHVKENETPVVAMLREIKEELGVEVKREDLEFVCVAARNNEPKEHVAYVFAIRDKEYAFTNAEPHKCSELVWVPLKNLPEDVADHARHMIEHGLVGGEKYLELGYAS